MLQRRESWGTIEAELRVPAATALVVRTHLPGPVDRISLDEDAFRFGLCLEPGPHVVRAGYPDHWGPHRLERLGHAFVMPPCERVQIRSDSGRDMSLMCQLRAEPIRAWLDADLRWPSHRLEATFDIRNLHIRSLLLRLADEVRHPGFASAVLVELVAVQLAIELARHCTAVAEEATPGHLAPWRLRLIDERLWEVREAPTLAELAGLCRLSVRQLTRGFRASRGCSVGEYVAQNQVEHARRLLATDETVKAIAYTLGFATPAGFAHAFRRATGESPHEFRQGVSRSK